MMTEPGAPAQAAAGLWPFSLKVYRQPGVPPACLLLQDRFGVDVNILLYACWMGGRGRALDAADCRRAIALCALWHGQVIAPARVLRRRLKPYAQADAGLDPVYQAFKAAELAAEKAQQAMLADQAADYGQASHDAPRASLILGNARAYLDSLGAALDAEGHAALALIAQQAEENR